MWYFSKGLATTVAAGCNKAHICAVTGSRSTPVISTSRPGGEVAMNTPGPQPGSRTRPLVNPAFAAAAHICAAISGEV